MMYCSVQYPHRRSTTASFVHPSAAVPPTKPGVHLNISMVAKLMASHPSVLPFLVYIPSESRHVERMAVRAKYMTLDPNKNRWARSGVRLRECHVSVLLVCMAVRAKYMTLGPNKNR
jgi:hypothetical protein